MASRSRDIFTTIHSEGALLPADLLQRIVDRDSNLGGLEPADYYLPGQRLNEAISQTWNRVQGAWTSFKAARERLPEGDLGTSITRERWLLPLFDALSYGRLLTARAVEIDGKSYPVSHRLANVPIHLVSYQLDLDRRVSGVAGAAAMSPHSLMQVYLNRSDDTLWGFLSNGLRLRILRDNASLTRQAFIDFDLEAMMEGEVYADFVLLYLLCHQSRVEGDRPSDFWLEKWMNAAQQQGTRALDQLREGVQAAIERLGAGFIDHPANHPLRQALQTGTLDTQDYYRQLLRLVYRLLFLFTAEDRGLLHPDGIEDDTRQRYHDYYSARRLREMAGRIKGTRHHDLFEGLRLVTRLLSGEAPYADAHRAALGLPALNGWLFREEAMGDIIDCRIANRDLLDGVRALAYTEDRSARLLRPVDYKNLGPEELGSVYESLLELHPQINIDARSFTLGSAAGHERKTTGSYYTPDSLVQALLDSALDPVIDQARRAADTEAALLALKICDPACGSGHFLIAAARRIARVLASVRTGEEEPPPAALRHAVRDVIGRCIYGVDINPMAVELCKVNLWMEALEPGKPLSFLDHRILCGNSLLGTTPALIAQGIPNDAFNPIEGDDKEMVAYFRNKNREERLDVFDPDRGAQLALFETQPYATHARLASKIAHLSAIPDDTLEGVWAQEAAYHQVEESRERIREKFLADLWCAVFVWEKHAIPRPDGYRLPPPTALLFDQLYHAEDPWSIDRPVEEIARETRQLAEQYQFFHWHVAFPDVFEVPERVEDAENTQTGCNGGFDCVLGNPPWETTAFQDNEFFATKAPEVLETRTTAQRKRKIENLKIADPTLFKQYLQARQQSLGETHFHRFSNYLPLGASGRINTYALFANVSILIVNHEGRSGVIVQTGIATDAPRINFWAYLVDSKRLISILDFENREGLFPAVHSGMKFCLLIVAGSAQEIESIRVGFWLTNPSQLNDPERIYELPTEVLQLINPDTRQPPVCRTRYDFELIFRIHRVSDIISSNRDAYYWGRAWSGLFTRASSQHFMSLEDLARGELQPDNSVVLDNRRFLPLIEAKMIHQFDYSFASYSDSSLQDVRAGHPREILSNERAPMLRPMPRFWAASEIVEEMYEAKSWEFGWAVGVRDVTNATNERTAIACILPKLGLLQPLNGILCNSAKAALFIVGAVNSFCLDYVARQKIAGLHLNATIFDQLPVPPLHQSAVPKLLYDLALELTYTTWDLQPFAQDIGYNGPPFIWNEDRRFLMRCELDALYFHLYQIAREDVDYIMETFPIVRRRDEQAYGEYRTKRVILQMYDQMAALPKISVLHPKGIDEEYLVPDISQFETWLEPGPADRSMTHRPHSREGID